tara:strand:+ start:31328 stop:32950 length:1623 start_codon:yes stop_codon:yes gene_type:complete
MSEARRGLIRITTNYGRLTATLVIGLILVPVQFAWVGTDGFGLLVAIGASAGLAAMFQDIMRHSMVRELGTVWHEMESPDAPVDAESHFRRVYASAFVLCGGIALLTAGVFALFLWLVHRAIWPFDTLPDEFRAAGQWILVAEGISTCLLILLAPAYNMYVVTERFLENNIWFTLKRFTYLLSAVVLFIVLGSNQVELSLKLYGVSVAALSMLILLVAVGRIMRQDPRLRPKLGCADRSALREIIGTFGWNGAVVTAMNLHERVGVWIMLGFFGLWGSTIFGLSMRLVSYVRMLTLGLTFGLDAVSARLSTGDAKAAFRSVVRHSTRLHAYVSIPAAITVFLLAEPLLRLWVGRTVQDPDPISGREVISATVILVKIMVIGLMSRAISEGWMKLLYGAGHIRHYAPLVLAGGIANPLIAWLLIEWLPPSWNWTGAAIAFGVVFLSVHLIMLPVTNAKQLGSTWQDILGALCRPAVLALVPTVVYAGVLLWTDPVPWWIVLPSCLVYAVAYGVLGIFLGLEPAERARILALWHRARTRRVQ